MKLGDFDKLIKDNLKCEEMFGYTTLPNNETEFSQHVYKNYYTNEQFASFCKEMKDKYTEIYKSYANGKGSELVGAPPKMASVASSSRFCYLALRNATIEVFGGKQSNHKFEFEKDCCVDNIKGTNPQMDAFYEEEDKDYYFEFKSREILENHTDKLSGQYDKNYLKPWGIERSDEKVPYEKFDLQERHLFDLKQFITHLIGIINGNKEKEKVFSYVYFRPYSANNAQNRLLEKLYEGLKNEFSAIANCEVVKEICEENRIELRLYLYRNTIMDGFEKNNNSQRNLLKIYPEEN